MEMYDPSRDACITLRLFYTAGDHDKLTSVFIKREGRDPTDKELEMEYNRRDAAYKNEFELTRERLVNENGIEPEFGDVTAVTYTRLRNLEYNSDYTPYYRGYDNLLYPSNANNMPPTTMSNPLDLTKRSNQSAPNTPTKKRKTDLKQANAGSVRSSPPPSTQPSSVSAMRQSKHGLGSKRTQSQPIQTLPKSHLQSDLQDNMSTVRNGKAVISTTRPGAKQARLKATAVAKTTTKTSTQPSAEKGAERSFEDLTGDSDAELAVTFEDKVPVASTRKLSSRPIFARQGSEGSSAEDGYQLPARPSFVRQHDTEPLLDDKDVAQHEMRTSAQPTPSYAPTVQQDPSITDTQQLPSFLSPQQSASTAPATESASSNRSTSGDFSTQLHERINDYIADAVGNIDDHTHRIFRDVALNTALWILQNTPSHDAFLASINSEITTNERNARAANKSLEAALESYSLMDVNLTPKAIDHYKLLDKQEQERQEALEAMMDSLKREDESKVKAVAKIYKMRNEIKEERDKCDREEQEEMRRMFGERIKSRSRSDDDSVKDEETRKRKRDFETEDHMDIDMLM